MNAKHLTQLLDPRCQSGPSARNSVVSGEGGWSKNYGADQQRLQISDPHFDKFTTSATFACWKIRFKTEVCTCSQFPTETMLVIKEVELVDSVDDLKSSCSVRGIQMPTFKSTRCEDCFSTEQNHPEYPLQEKGQSGGTKIPKKTPFPSWNTDRLPDLQVLPGNWSQRFCRDLCRPIYSCSSK